MKGKLGILVVLVMVAAVGISPVFAGGGQESKASEKAEAESDEWVVGIANISFVHPFHEAWLELQPGVDEEFGCKSVFLNCEFDIDKQLSDIDSLIAMDVDVLHVNPADVVAVEPAVKKALGAGIKTMSGANKVAVSGNINALLGAYKTFANIAELIAAYMNYEGNVLYVSGLIGNFASDQRQDGFLETIAKYENINVLDWQPGDFDAGKSVAIVENWISKYGDEIDAIVFCDDTSALPSLETLKSYGRDDILVTGYVAGEEALKAIESGDILLDALISPSLFAYYTTNIAYRIHMGQDLPDDVYMTTPIIMNEDTFKRITSNGYSNDDLVWATPDGAREMNESASALYGIDTAKEPLK